MSRRISTARFGVQTGVVFGLVVWGVCGGVVRAEARDRPNLLVLIADDHAAYALGANGDNHGATPNLDRLTREGVSFARAYCVAPVCSASRQAFLTGRYPHAVGVTLLTTPLDEETITLADWLRMFGYRTAAIGKMHFNNAKGHGFDERVDTPHWRRALAEEASRLGVPVPERRPWRPFAVPAAEWLNAANASSGLHADNEEASFFKSAACDFLARHVDQRFALVVSFHEPHSPFVYPQEWEGLYRPEQFSVRFVSESDRLEQPEIFAPLSAADVRGIQAAYYTSLNFMDHQIGMILDELDRLGLAENTIVVYFGDNGYLLGHRGRFEKHVLYEPAVRVPLMVRWPGRFPGARRHVEMVELVDVFPTLLDLMGLAVPSELDGRSFAGLIRGEPGARGRDHVFSEYLENEEAMIRSERYKLIIGTGARQRRDGYQTGRPLPGPYARLYDLQDDPQEQRDLAGREQVAAIQAELQCVLADRLARGRREDDRAPAGLSELEAIRWYLRPRDGGD